MSLRTKFSLTFALIPLMVVVPSYLFGVYFTLSPKLGYHAYDDLYSMALSSLVNAPLLGVAAFASWRLFGDRRDNLFYKSLIGNLFFGFLIPLAALLVFLIAVLLLRTIFGYIGIPLWDSAIFRNFFWPIWGSVLFVMLTGGIVGVIFGKRRGVQEGPN
ncbi:MAG: hypothetical protein K0U72_02890 [Gammaproteobacteria bacterium]|nr:hypothetical protein [Gammaproteobacteria bacterium]